jgi:adenylosuccinate lyase
VGTGAAWGKKARKLQAEVMRMLGLSAPDATTQILQRDRLAELLCFLALVGSTFDKIAREIRNLQRTEIGELSEPFAEAQVGSSTMPHKRNPIQCEKICGLARVLRSHVSAALENVVLEHERDLTNSSCERVLIPQSFLLLDEILRTAHHVIKNLKIFPERMTQNIELTKGLNMAEAIMIELVRRGMDRQEAHRLLRSCSSKALIENRSLSEILKSEPSVTQRLADHEIDSILDPKHYLGAALSIVDSVLKKFSKKP